MSYTPHTSHDVHKMLEVIGINTVEQLFEDIPAAIRLDRKLNLPQALTEPELWQHVGALAQKNNVYSAESSFLGGGANRHYIPAMIDQMISRSEFYTAYTPYQPEISQGTLQAIFEFQSLICSLTDMEVANASMYDGASAAAEACLMALRITRRKKIVVSEGVHPLYRAVIETYVKHQQAELIAWPVDGSGGHIQQPNQTDIDDTIAAVIVQYPSFFGTVQDLGPLAELLHQHNALLIAVVAEPLALGILTPPGAMTADIVAGDGQSFGIPTQFGGPYVGFLATRLKQVRQMPGRLVGQTVDAEGRRGFVLTLATREQHIRREKATSNICSNQGLCALAASIAMAMLGKTGLRKLAEINLSKTEYLKSALKTIPWLSFPYSGPTFNECVVRTQSDERPVLEHCKKNGLLAGLSLRQFSPAWAQHILLSVTELNSRTEIDRLVNVLHSYSG
ncbi:aminomethyl-transferring glycine dehydrogenase subunit GcvPA [bacterium]|nr:aminomethyl-transferring glycine dehydrogenase subunit GcvPA [bacterium]